MVAREYRFSAAEVGGGSGPLSGGLRASLYGLLQAHPDFEGAPGI